MAQAQKTPVAEATLSLIATTVKALHAAVKAEASAAAALDRKSGATWRAVQAAAEPFPATMSKDDRTALSGALAKDYATVYRHKDAAKVCASQHAKAIHMIATGVQGEIADDKGATRKAPAAEFASMKAYFAACREPKQQADAGNPPNNAGNPGASANPSTDDAAVKAAAETRATALSTAGMTVELGSAFVRLIEAAKRSTEVADAVMFAANSPERLVEFVAYVLGQRAQENAAKLAGALGAKVRTRKPAKDAAPAQAAAYSPLKP